MDSPPPAPTRPFGHPARRGVVCPPVTGLTGQFHGYGHGHGLSGQASGDVTVSIPAAVFVQPHGHQLVVTTNTGKGPRVADTFYLVTPEKAQIASATFAGKCSRPALETRPRGTPSR